MCYNKNNDCYFFTIDKDTIYTNEFYYTTSSDYKSYELCFFYGTLV